jgi:hypothetical protein
VIEQDPARGVHVNLLFATPTGESENVTVAVAADTTMMVSVAATRLSRGIIPP